MNRYLKGHLVVTAVSGILWVGFAIFLTDLNSEINLFITSLFLTSITLGGLMAGAVHRPSYLGSGPIMVLASL